MLFSTAEATNSGDKLKKPLHPHVAITGRAFGQVTHLLLRLQNLRLHVETAHRGRAAIRRQKSGKHFHSGGFAGAVGAEEAEHFARFNVKG